MPGDGRCAWVSGDLGRLEHNGRDGDSYLAEVDFCNRLREKELMLGIGLSKSGSEEGTAFSGNSDIDGQYLLAEAISTPG